jgi:hypothetical protein
MRKLQGQSTAAAIPDWKALWERVSSEIPDIRRKLEARFRDLLGDRGAKPGL